jgi:hypothetical protein
MKNIFIDFWKNLVHGKFNYSEFVVVAVSFFSLTVTG